MLGINLNAPIQYHSASFRYFKENEHHTKRVCADNVLLLVFEGVLKFQEDGKEYAIKPGQYHIQKQNSYQVGTVKSEMPKYLYVHFLGNECEMQNGILAFDGEFDIQKFMPLMEKLDETAHNNSTYIAQAAVFYQILSKLSLPELKENSAVKIAEFIEKNYYLQINLENIKNEFSFSKNHIINLFKKEYGITPIEYLIRTRINNALRKIEATSDSLEEIAYSCGFNDYPYFYKVFKNKVGVSPEVWRKQRRENI